MPQHVDIEERIVAVPLLLQQLGELDETVDVVVVDMADQHQVDGEALGRPLRAQLRQARLEGVSPYASRAAIDQADAGLARIAVQEQETVTLLGA